VIDANGVLPAAAAALGVAAGRFDGTVASLVSLLTGRRVLLVLDNVEHVLACAPDLASLVAGCPELVVLATGRAALRVRAEQEVPVAPLGSAETLRMFRERMAAGGSLGDGGPRADAAVAALCRRTDGLPLAVELAASAAALLGPSTVLDQLDAGAPTVNEARDLPARQRSMAATVDWSYRLLGVPARSLLRRLSACAGRFSLVLATDLADEEPDVVLVGLAELLEHSLVVRTTEVEGVERFRLFEPIRERVAAMLPFDEAEIAQAALARSVLAHARALGEDLRGPGQGSALRLLEADLGNVRVAFEYLLAGHEPADRAAELLFLVAPFLAVIGHAWGGPRVVRPDLGPAGERRWAGPGARRGRVPGHHDRPRHRRTASPRGSRACPA
jgi:predicted ATPase